jgi:hypothetical protein
MVEVMPLATLFNGDDWPVVTKIWSNIVYLTLAIIIMGISSYLRNKSSLFWLCCFGAWGLTTSWEQPEFARGVCAESGVSHYYNCQCRVTKVYASDWVTRKPRGRKTAAKVLQLETRLFMCSGAAAPYGRPYQKRKPVLCYKPLSRVRRVLIELF